MRELCAAACKAVGLRAYARGYAYLRLSAQIRLRFGASYVPPSASKTPYRCDIMVTTER